MYSKAKYIDNEKPLCYFVKDIINEYNRTAENDDRNITDNILSTKSINVISLLIILIMPTNSMSI